MRLSLNKSNKRLAKRRESYERSINQIGFVNRSQPKGIGHDGYRRPGSNKKG